MWCYDKPREDSDPSVVFIPVIIPSDSKMRASIASLYEGVDVDGRVGRLLFRSVFVNQELHTVQCPIEHQMIRLRPMDKLTSVWCMSLDFEQSRRSDA